VTRERRYHAASEPVVDYHDISNITRTRKGGKNQMTKALYYPRWGRRSRTSLLAAGA